MTAMEDPDLNAVVFDGAAEGLREESRTPEGKRGFIPVPYTGAL
jgi:hypothetical protein